MWFVSCVHFAFASVRFRDDCGHLPCCLTNPLVIVSVPVLRHLLDTLRLSVTVNYCGLVGGRACLISIGSAC